MAKDVGPGQLLVKYGLASYQKHRIVAYSAYIFKALGITPAQGLCRMHPQAIMCLSTKKH